MIFVTVGTHEQPFNRLIEHIDKLKGNGVIKEDVIIQRGYSTYTPKYCQWSTLFSYQEMVKYVNEARIVVTHGGPSSFVMPIQIGKVPIVVPRTKEYGEHVNNHQVEFAKAVAERQQTILLAESMDKLEELLINYSDIVEKMNSIMQNNNETFIKEFKKIVQELF